MNVLKTMKYSILTFLFACVALTSCIDDDLPICPDNGDEMEMFTDGYSLTMVVTLDRMGGTRAGEPVAIDPREKELEELESYIDPERVRLLVFDREDRFLFESKSRWVKKMDPATGEYTQWLVSVPLYDYGNDESKGWNWEEIRRVLTGEDMKEDIARYEERKSAEGCNYHEKAIKEAIAETPDKPVTAFKIAILANRPGKEWNMGINARYETGNTVIPPPNNTSGDIKDAEGNPVAKLTEGGWSIKNGPNWAQEHTRWGDKTKTVFDLHHCQYDPIYHGKSYNDRGYQFTQASDKWEPHGEYDGKTLYFYNYNVYDFVAGEVKKGEGYDDYIGKPTMGATSTWVDWSNGGENYATINGTKTSYRYFVAPSQDHPIPMYGIQSFSKIDADQWPKGTPFNLSEIVEGSGEEAYKFKTISLLRSVVRLELVLPNEADWVAIYYPNVYARCEPMNVWDPTDEIWEKNAHEHKSNQPDGCEWYNIRKYGAVTRSSEGKYHKDAKDLDTEQESVKHYQKRMSWFYGAWKDYSPDGETYPWQEKLQPLQPFDNCQDGDAAPDYPQIFNSCVQRVTAAICPKELGYIGSDGLWHYVVYVGERNINDPSNITRMGANDPGAPTICYWQFRYQGSSYSIGLAYSEENSEGTVRSYKSGSESTPKHDMGGDGSYEQAVQNGTTSTTITTTAMPWPLLRNHVYRINVTTLSGGGSTEPSKSSSWNFTELSEATISMIKDDTWWGGPYYKTETNRRGENYTHYYNTEWATSKGKQSLMAGSKHADVIPETDGLLFSYGENKEAAINFEQIYTSGGSDVWTKWYLRLNTDVSFTFPNVSRGQIITIKSLIPITAGNQDAEIKGRYVAPDSPSDVTFIPQNKDTLKDGEEPGESEKGEVKGKGKQYKNPIYVFRWQAEKNGNITFNVTDGGLAFTMFCVCSGADNCDCQCGCHDENASRSRFASASDASVLEFTTETFASKSLKPRKVTPPMKME